MKHVFYVAFAVMLIILILQLTLIRMSIQIMNANLVELIQFLNPDDECDTVTDFKSFNEAMKRHIERSNSK